MTACVDDGTAGNIMHGIYCELVVSILYGRLFPTNYWTGKLQTPETFKTNGLQHGVRVPSRVRKDTLQSTRKHLKGYLTLTPWSESASELYRPSDHRLSAK
jgi:hypothetical protein